MLVAEQKHYQVGELAKMWGLSYSKVRRMFEEEQGVLRLGEPGRREGRAFRRRYFTMRIPESVAERVYARLTGKRKLF
jgi:hypothetical protein